MEDTINIVVVLIVVGAIAIGLISMLIGKLVEWRDRFVLWRESVNHYQPPPVRVMSPEPVRQPQTAQTDRQTSVSVADQWLDRLEVDRTRAALIELLVYSDWSLSEIRSIIKGDNGTIGAEVEAARQRLAKPPRLMHVNNERYIPLDVERVA
jgi:hypothetical protein